MTWQSIQLMRGLAVLAVVAYHFGGWEPGAAGVDLFFVISGFIMAQVARGRAPADFLRDRALRILPTYYAALLVHLLLVQPAWDGDRMVASLRLDPLVVTYLHQSWTLTYELIFYAGCAAYLWVGRPALMLAPLLLAAAAIMSNRWLDFAGDPLILEFLGGVALAHVPRRHGLAALLAAPVAFLAFQALELHRAVAFGVPSLLLVHAALSQERRLGGAWLPVGLAIGDASYSIYLVHLSVGQLLLPFDIGWVSAALLSVGGGLIFYRWVERPLLRIGKRFRSRPAEVPATPGEVPTVPARIG